MRSGGSARDWSSARDEERNPAPEDALGVEGRVEPNVDDEVRRERATRREKRKHGAGKRERERETARDLDVTLTRIHSVV